MRYNDGNPMNTPTNTNRNALLLALQRAKDTLGLKRVAEESGVDYAAIKNFRSHKTLGPDRARLLAEYLHRHGYLADAPPVTRSLVTLSPDDPLPQAATLLRALADLLDNPALPREHRAALLRQQTQTLTLLQSLADTWRPPSPKK